MNTLQRQFGAIQTLTYAIIMMVVALLALVLDEQPKVLAKMLQPEFFAPVLVFGAGLLWVIHLVYLVARKWFGQILSLSIAVFLGFPLGWIAALGIFLFLFEILPDVLHRTFF